MAKKYESYVQIVCPITKQGFASVAEFHEKILL